jgi:hypothetical protein
MNLTLYLYVFSAALMVASGTYYFYKGGSTVTSGIYALGSLIIAVFFGTRWFLPSGISASAGSQWPPVINVCPDFLTLYNMKLPSGVSKNVCIDTIGVSTNGGLQVWKDPSQTDPKFYFDPTPTPVAPATLTSTLCDQCTTQGLSWEGIYDGTACTSVNTPPAPPANAIPTASSLV